MHLTEPFDSRNDIPWSESGQWQQVQLGFRRMIDPYASLSLSLAALAHEIAFAIRTIDPVMTRLCGLTCPYCPDPCCLHASVWFDFKDLLYLHLTANPIPASQPMGRHVKECIYWRPRGCCISRHLRPWVCTWYLCPTQTAQLKRNAQNSYSRLIGNLQAIKTRRQQMEDELIRLVSGAVAPPNR